MVIGIGKGNTIGVRKGSAGGVGGESFGLPGVLVFLRPHRLAEPITFAIHLEDVALVRQPVEQRYNCCLIGGSGTGKTHLATALGLALCRLGKRVRFLTAAGLVTQLEEAQQEHRLDRALSQLDRLDLLIVDELGYLSFSRAGAELLFQVFAERYERRSVLITSNLPFGEWGQVFQGERMTAALLDRLTHRCHIFEMNGESYRFRESMKAKKEKDPKRGK